MKKVYFFIILIFLKNIQLHDINENFDDFKNRIKNLTENAKQENKMDCMQYIVTNLNLSTEYTAFFETTIKRKNLKITKKSDLLKIFHPDKCADKVEEKKVNILYNHFFYPILS